MEKRNWIELNKTFVGINEKNNTGIELKLKEK